MVCFYTVAKENLLLPSHLFPPQVQKSFESEVPQTSASLFVLWFHNMPVTSMARRGPTNGDYNFKSD